MEFDVSPGTRTAVLVEGTSDKVAVETLAARRGRDLALERVTVVALGGVTNALAFVTLFRGFDLRMVGLCDIRERRYFEGTVETFFTCDPDLEGELLRALGVDEVERVIDGLGLLPALRTFENQPAQRDRRPDDRLRRFMGTMSGRKALFARALTEALDVAPRPLDDLLASF